MGVGLLIMVTGAILIAALGSPGSGWTMSAEPEKIAGPIVLGVGFIVLVIGIVVSIYLKKKKPEQHYPSRAPSHAGHLNGAMDREDSYMRHQAATVSNNYPMNYPMYGHNPHMDSAVPMYGPPAPMATRKT